MDEFHVEHLSPLDGWLMPHMDKTVCQEIKLHKSEDTN